jgi:type IV pilus assembly protein PilA
MPRALLRRLAGRTEAGFTLVELMVVVLIIAILLAIAIPTFLGVRTRAQDRAAQTSLRNSLVAAKTLYLDAQDYSQATPAALSAVAPDLDYLAADSTGPREVSVGAGVSTATAFYAAVRSDSGRCFYLKDDVTAGGGGTTYAKSSVAACGATATPAGGYSAGGW